jgi:glucan phosphoethanolaminetransferase (alkaline phosphatase superfamily)
MAMEHTETRQSIGAVQVGIALLALGTAGIHLYLFLIEGFLGNGKMLPIYQILFVGNVLGYVSLAAVLLLPLNPLARVRSFVRVLLISIAVASIASYFYVGVLDAVGHTDKVIEVLLILLVTADAATSDSEEDLAGRFAGGALGAVLQLAVGIAVGVAMFLALTPLLV